MPMPICPPCKKEMRVEKNGVPITNGIYLYFGDKYKCPRCGSEVVARFGEKIDLNVDGNEKHLKTANQSGLLIEVDNL